MVDFTVAIRTYNGGDRLPAILDQLRSQTDTEGIHWEVLIVDNNSTDHTKEVVQTYQKDWYSHCPLRYVCEPRQGAAFARRKAMQAAQGSLVGFLDDDNIPHPNWVAAACTFGKAHPQAGAFGGQIHGQYEGVPPANFSRIAPFLPVIERKQIVCYTSKEYPYSHKKVLPPGAGLVVRKQAWDESVPEQLSLPGPVGDSLVGKGEDIEILMHIWQAGWEIWHNPEMHIHHIIPPWRFERDYLIRFFQGVGLSKYRTRMVGYQFWQKPFFTVAYFLNDFRKAILHFVKYKNVLQTDTVAACEMELFRASLLGPFYALRRSMFKV